MEKLERYREIIQQALLPLTQRKYSDRNLVNEPVFDETNDRYLVMSVGWEGKIRRIHGCLAHLDIINGKSMDTARRYRGWNCVRVWKRQESRNLISFPRFIPRASVRTQAMRSPDD